MAYMFCKDSQVTSDNAAMHFVLQVAQVRSLNCEQAFQLKRHHKSANFEFLPNPFDLLFRFCGCLRFFAGVLRVFAGVLRAKLVADFGEISEFVNIRPLRSRALGSALLGLQPQVGSVT